MGGIAGEWSAGDNGTLPTDNYDRGAAVATGFGVNGTVVPGFTGANFAAMFGYLDERAFYDVWEMLKGDASNDPANRPLLSANKEAVPVTP